MGQTKILDYEGFASRGGAIYNPQDIWNYDIIFEADQAFVEADELLASTPGMTGIDYASKREEWAYALETFQMLDQFRKDFIEEVQEMDERFYRQVVNGPAEDLSHVSMSEISIPNRTSLQNFDPLYQTYYEKKELTFQDFIGSPDMSQQPYVEGFSDIFQYDDAEYADLTMQEKIRVLENGTVYENEFYMPEKEALLYLTEEYCLGFKQLYDGISGYDIITGEQLSQAERIERSDQGIIYLFLNALLLYQSVRSLGAVKKLVTLVNEGKIDDVLRLNNRGYLDFRKGSIHSLPQGVSQEQFSNASVILRNDVGNISDDIVVQGSRAKGTAKPTSDIDIAVRVSPEQFDELINQYFKTPNPGSAKERTMLHAIETGKIQSGEAKLKGVRLQLQEVFGMDVDISIIKIGGPFDNPPFISIE